MPAEGRFLRLARLCASGVAVSCGMPLDEIEDFRLVIDEIGALLVESSGPDGSAVIRLTFAVSRGALVVEGTAAATHAPDPRRVALSDQILAVLTDGYERAVDGDVLRVVATTRLRAAGAG
jgi:hypothetical protein